MRFLIHRWCQGFTTVSSAASNGPVSRVATINPLEAAMAAIYPLCASEIVCRPLERSPQARQSSAQLQCRTAIRGRQTVRARRQAFRSEPSCADRPAAHRCRTAVRFLRIAETAIPAGKPLRTFSGIALDGWHQSHTMARRDLDQFGGRGRAKDVRCGAAVNCEAATGRKRHIGKVVFRPRI